MHMCCGYPGHLDDEDHLKADPESYFQLAAAIDETTIQQVSIEDAHCLNDLSLLELYKDTAVILGVVAVASSRVESVGEITDRLRNALDHIDADRLVAAPDCGLLMLERKLAMRKLTNLCTAAHSI
ncbi:MAG: 5-methyltetrahydropteroyltriglutamate--homocysteine methyltransferase [Parasphingorhabdus sp.]|jgi:5-methyltetrahydropteroyltriglutamate--homocysteine methyltransferase